MHLTRFSLSPLLLWLLAASYCWLCAVVACYTSHPWRSLADDLGITLPGGVQFEKYDVFHDLILSEEFKRLGTYGLADGLLGAFSIGFPPVLSFGSPAMIAKVAPALLRGEKRIALAISEPYAGSDVANIRTRGELSADGSHWIVNGVKKWITGGYWADYFTTLVRCPQGMTLMLISREMGVETKKIKTSYSASAGTAYVEFRDARVPVDCVIGEVGKGFYYSMSNFNKERWAMAASGNRMSRLMVEECFKWALQRKVFGKRLIDQPVIRLKLAEMAAEVEGVHSFIEDVTYQMSKMTEASTSDDSVVDVVGSVCVSLLAAFTCCSSCCLR
ncbi:unnamed protein product [Polarella glacialis]|uniref:Acyl-CoA dehydrogenase n=1 Tax=Polarella glacialis TaxID=89957 RepID=A0A813JDU8_POLGL|nr:unnamed protein product [Polarella glacialis]